MDLSDRELEMMEGVLSRHATELIRYLLWIDDMPSLPQQETARQRVRDEAAEYRSAAIKIMEERRRRRTSPSV